MSAYIVDKNHILYLVTAAMSHRMNPGQGAFHWIVKNERAPQGYDCHTLNVSDYLTAVDAANTLWCENIKSVSARYPNESSATLPGTNESNYVVTPSDFNGIHWMQIDPVQVLKACDCYEYQSCEHEGWEQSEAHAFIQSLRKRAWQAFPGYEKAKWGAPEPYNHPTIRLTAMARR